MSGICLDHIGYFASKLLKHDRLTDGPGALVCSVHCTTWPVYSKTKSMPAHGCKWSIIVCQPLLLRSQHVSWVQSSKNLHTVPVYIIKFVQVLYLYLKCIEVTIEGTCRRFLPCSHLCWSYWDSACVQFAAVDNHLLPLIQASFMSNLNNIQSSAFVPNPNIMPMHDIYSWLGGSPAQKSLHGHENPPVEIYRIKWWKMMMNLLALYFWFITAFFFFFG